MSDLKHRTLPELKSFAKKFKEHFKLNVSKIKKVELLKRIDEGMLKAINPTLQKGLKDEYERLRQPKGKKSVVKKAVVKKDEKPKVEKKKVIKIKLEKPKVEKPKVKPSESKLLQVKGVGSVSPPKIKPPMATMEITPKPKGKVKQAVAKIEKKTVSKKKESSSCHFDKQYLNIPSDLDKDNIIYNDPNKNIKLEFFIKNPKIAPDTIRLDYMSSRESDSKEPAPKGATREALCGVLQELVKRNIVTKNGTIDLIAGKVTVKGVRHNLKKLKTMYESMSFKKAEGVNTYEQKIGDLMKWCKSKYPDCID